MLPCNLRVLINHKLRALDSTGTQIAAKARCASCNHATRVINSTCNKHAHSAETSILKLLMFIHKAVDPRQHIPHSINHPRSCQLRHWVSGTHIEPLKKRMVTLQERSKDPRVGPQLSSACEGGRLASSLKPSGSRGHGSAVRGSRTLGRLVARPITPKHRILWPGPRASKRNRKARLLLGAEGCCDGS